MRVVIDTNVLLSGLIRPQGAPGAIIRALRDGRIVPVLSRPMLEEIGAVLSRSWLLKKYGVEPADVETVLNFLVARGELVEPRIEIRRCRDPRDDMFLEAAVSAAADRIVTGDKDLLDMGSVEGVPIVTARQMADELA
jgi:putative PIN family toxin of toxin-antitoxin system